MPIAQKRVFSLKIQIEICANIDVSGPVEVENCILPLLNGHIKINVYIYHIIYLV